MDITVQQVELLSDDDYIYLDVRGEIAYQHGHIPKAYEWAGGFSHIKELPKDKKLVVYCNYGVEECSDRRAAKVKKVMMPITYPAVTENG